ncbi:uncharacterized protein [Macaca nemestrina]|uniref:uncharacterized protein isoform X4 n=1 Tax=Macaca nemestrina TaxID=9545 RepID=UPI0039B8ECD1
MGLLASLRLMVAVTERLERENAMRKASVAHSKSSNDMESHVPEGQAPTRREGHNSLHSGGCTSTFLTQPPRGIFSSVAGLPYNMAAGFQEEEEVAAASPHSS